MSVELKVFGGAYFPKDKALKKNPDLKPLAIAINSTTKTIAEAVIFGKLAAEYPERIDDYFKAKIWEDREGLPCPALDIFSSDFFGASVIWLDKPGEPAPVPAESEANAGNQDGAEPVLKSVKQLDQNSRAACLVLFGPVEEITSGQYGQIVDLTNDDESSFNQNLAIAITKETRALALEPERQEQLLAWVREKASETAQWPDIKKLLTKWIDTPADKRESAATCDENNDAILLDLLRLDTALGVLSASMDFDIYEIPEPIVKRARTMEEAASDPRFSAWWKQFRRTPNVFYFSRAARIAMIKTAPEDLYLKPIELRAYIDNLAEASRGKPTPQLVDIACGRSSLPVPQQDTTNEETRPLSPGEANPPANVPLSDKEFEADIARAERARDAANQQPKIENIGGGVYSVDALLAQQPSNPAQTEEAPALLTEREQSIKALVEQVLAGNTALFDEEEAGTLIANAGHDFSHLAMMIMIDIFALENGENPEIIDDFDIQHLAWGALEEWSDNPETRLDILTRLLGEYRKQDAIDRERNERCKKENLSPSKSVQILESVNQPAITLTYQQQLTIAALSGLCSNPAHATSLDNLAGWVVELVDDVIRQQKAAL